MVPSAPASGGGVVVLVVVSVGGPIGPRESWVQFARPIGLVGALDGARTSSVARPFLSEAGGRGGERQLAAPPRLPS